MNIAFFSYYYFPRASASTWSTFALTKQLSKKNIVKLIVPNIKYKIALNEEDSKEFEKNNQSIVYKTPKIKIPQDLAPFITPFFLFFKGVKEVKSSDVIICQFQPHHFTFIVGFFLSKIYNIPIVARANDIHREMGVENYSSFQRLNIFRRSMFNTLNEAFVKYADAFLVVCAENKRILESRVGKLHNINLNFNGVDESEFFNIDKSGSLQHLQLQDSDKIILFVGRFSGPEYKIEVLMNAMKKVQNILPECILLLVGDKLPDNIKQRNLSQNLRVRVVGHVPRSEIKHYLSVADLCIGPLGRTNAIPLKILEYMICGKPVITGFKSVSQDVAIDGYNCLVIPPEPDLLADTIVEVLQNNEYAEYLGKNARETALRFTWDSIAEELEIILLKTLRKRIAKK